MSMRTQLRFRLHTILKRISGFIKYGIRGFYFLQYYDYLAGTKKLKIKEVKEVSGRSKPPSVLSGIQLCVTPGQIPGDPMVLF